MGMGDLSWQTSIARQIWVFGRVQGVGFRDYTQQQAKSLGLSGWVRNHADGRVEIQCCGPADQVEALIEWCRQGSPAAAVERVAISENVVGKDFPEPFEIRPSVA